MTDNPRLTERERENLVQRCQLRGSANTAREFGVPELELLRALIGIAVPEVVLRVRPKLEALWRQLESTLPEFDAAGRPLK